MRRKKKEKDYDYAWIFAVSQGWQIASNGAQKKHWFCTRNALCNPTYDYTAGGAIRFFGSMAAAARRRDTLATMERNPV